MSLAMILLDMPHFSQGITKHSTWKEKAHTPCFSKQIQRMMPDFTPDPGESEIFSSLESMLFNVKAVSALPPSHSDKGSDAVLSGTGDSEPPIK